MKSTHLFLLFFLLNFNLTAQDSSSTRLKQLLSDISAKAIELDSRFLSQEQITQKWIGYHPAPENEILDAEKRLGIKLPADYIDFLRITNGFEDANGVEATFGNISQIDYLKNTDTSFLQILKDYWPRETFDKLKNSIQVGGFKGEQQFYLVPPDKTNKDWEYWHFAHWAPGETVYNSLEDYFKGVLETTMYFLEPKMPVRPNRIILVEMKLSAMGVESDDFPTIEMVIDFRENTSKCLRSYYNPAYEDSTYSLTSEEMQAIKTLLEHANLELLKEEYTVPYSDQPTSKMIIYTPDKRYPVYDYGLKGDPLLTKLYELTYKIHD